MAAQLANFQLTNDRQSAFGIDDGWYFVMVRRARWQEVDGFGHVNNLAYLGYYEDARNNYLECVGLPPLNANEPGPVIATTTETYVKPLVFEDEFAVTARTVRLGRTSLTMEYAVWKDGLCATGQAVCVLMINSTGAKVAVPGDVRARIKDLERATLDET